MRDRLHGRTAIVVGAGRGIGRGIAEVFLEAGARVVIADRERELGLQTAKALAKQGHVHFVEADVAERADMQAVVAEALRQFGRVDILAQNAGIYPYTLIEAVGVEEWDRVLAVNLRGCFLAAQACLEPMRAQGYGRMIFTSSITGPRVSLPGHSHYSASKAGINGFIRAAAIEFAPHGITVNGVEPGNIVTEGLLSDRSPDYIRAMERSVPLGRLGTPRDVGHAFLYLASEEAAFVTGTTIVVDGGQTLPEGKV